VFQVNNQKDQTMLLDQYPLIEKLSSRRLSGFSLASHFLIFLIGGDVFICKF